jgi:hypothetical protein
MNKPTDRDIALGSGSTSFEADCAIARHCSRLGYLVSLEDVQKWSEAAMAAVVAWVESELIADRPAFLDRYRHDNQEDTMAPKKPTKDPKPKKPKEKGAKGDVKIEHFQQPMPCALSPEEVIDRGNKVMNLLSDKEMKQADIKSVTAHLKADIKQIDADIAKLSKEHTEKRCYRSVEIRREYRYRVGSVVDIRTDLDDVINERPLTGTERQLEDERLSKAPAKPKGPEAANDGDEAGDPPGSDDAPESGEQVDEDDDSEASAE